jgi:hypothetical protein
MPTPLNSVIFAEQYILPSSPSSSRKEQGVDRESLMAKIAQPKYLWPVNASVGTLQDASASGGVEVIWYAEAPIQYDRAAKGWK